MPTFVKNRFAPVFTPSRPRHSLTHRIERLTRWFKPMAPYAVALAQGLVFFAGLGAVLGLLIGLSR